VHDDYRNHGRGDTLLKAIEDKALRSGLEKLFVLTTRTAHWFRERGFQPGDISQLPARKKNLYNYQRKSRMYVKTLKDTRNTR
jgi:amino-acid N-acetyltransferase